MTHIDQQMKQAQALLDNEDWLTRFSSDVKCSDSHDLKREPDYVQNRTLSSWFDDLRVPKHDRGDYYPRWIKR